jgi:hypothetical protein
MEDKAGRGEGEERGGVLKKVEQILVIALD